MTQRVLAEPDGPGNVVFDVDGCLSVGGVAIPGARRTLNAARDLGMRTLIATNNSTRTPEYLAERLSDILSTEFATEDILTSAIAAVSLLGTADSPVLVVGEDGIHAELSRAGFEVTQDPDGAGSVIVGLDRAFDYTALRRSAQAVLGGARLIGTNADATFPSDGPDHPGAGSILRAVETASGRAAEVAGKPEAPMIAAVESRLSAGPTWMVGDRIETDIAFGKAAGWKTVLVLTGVTSAGAAAEAGLQADHTIDSVAGLSDLLGP